MAGTGGPVPGRESAEAGHALLVAGWSGATWHLELVGDLGSAAAAPTEENLLVLYADGVIDDDVVSRLIEADGTRVAAATRTGTGGGSRSRRVLARPVHPLLALTRLPAICFCRGQGPICGYRR
jgi:hypothetical protein